MKTTEWVSRTRKWRLALSGREGGGGRSRGTRRKQGWSEPRAPVRLQKRQREWVSPPQATKGMWEEGAGGPSWRQAHVGLHLRHLPSPLLTEKSSVLLSESQRHVHCQNNLSVWPACTTGDRLYHQAQNAFLVPYVLATC